MKKKIGFIDLYIDEWHANHYPEWIRTSKYADEFDLYMAWQQESRPNLRSLEAWCEEFGAVPAKSQEELIEACDGLIVLAPSNPEVHEQLAEKALKSGKPLYIDKPFAPDRAAAERIIALADKYNTPLFSTSCMRYAREIAEVKATTFKDEKIEFASATGNGSSYWEYCIHIFEMVTALMGTGAHRLMQTTSPDATTKHVVVEYKDGRTSAITYAPELPSQFIVSGPVHAVAINQCTDCFPTLLNVMIKFFKDRQVPVPHAETVEIAAMVGQSIAAQRKPNEWFYL